MWKIGQIKRDSRVIFRKNYWHIIIICFVMAYLTGAYAMSGAAEFLKYYNVENENPEAVQKHAKIKGKSNLEVIRDLVIDDVQMIRPPERGNYTRGVFAAVFNSATEEDSIVFGTLNLLNASVFKGKIVYDLILVIGLLIYFLLWFFVKNVLRVCQARYFLEGMVYDETPFSRILFLIRVRRWKSGATAMFWAWLYQALWNLTIIGGVIKSYSYRMVPYIVAENPSIRGRDAIRMSRRMMNGHKMHCFLLDLSFIGWDLLSIFTFGIVGDLYSNPYQTAAETQLYMVLRENLLQKDPACREVFNDHYIGLHPVIPKGYEQLPATYPVSLFSVPEAERRQWIKVEYRRDYSIWSLILLFFTFSIIGWLWEGALHLMEGELVNRGVLHGPWLPIYGFGGIFILVLLKKTREKPALTFILTILLCGVLEYFTSYVLELLQGKRWWDYSGYLLNLNGRICAEGLMVFGLGGCAFIYFAAPLFDDLYKKIKDKHKKIICSVLMVIFVFDAVYSFKNPNEGKGITDYDQYTTERSMYQTSRFTE